MIRRTAALLLLTAILGFAAFRCSKLHQADTLPDSSSAPLAELSATEAASSAGDVTEPPTEPSTEPPTEAPTEPPTEPDESWKLTLVNRWNALPEDYDISLLTLSNGISVDERIYPDLQAMFDDARANGLQPMVREGFRTRSDQEAIMAERIAGYEAEGYSGEEARQKAEEFVAIPGTSEHELGLAVDINSTSDDAWGLYNWLAENAHEYGFILRYPQDKKSITGIDYEPWHYRYVGKEAAAEIHARQLTLEEYLQG
ncbi:MAG: M15 family metallopeptidase [Oscillospiraceae bacterium]|nr:M15 family metallopeptidase [Oscillospiraceae bacterium]